MSLYISVPYFGFSIVNMYEIRNYTTPFRAVYPETFYLTLRTSGKTNNKLKFLI